MIQGHCQRAHSLRGDRNDAVWFTAAPLATADHHSIFLERTQRSSSRLASSLFKIFLNSFSSAFRVDCISLRVSAFLLALAPTSKAATRRLLASRNFSCSFFSHAARSTILLLDHLHPRWIIRAAQFSSSNRVIEMKYFSSSETSTPITVAGFTRNVVGGHHGQFCHRAPPEWPKAAAQRPWNTPGIS